MFGQPREGEGASGHGGKVARHSRLDGGLDELAADATTAHRLGDEGVEQYEMLQVAVVSQVGQSALGRDLEAVLGRVVYGSHYDSLTAAGTWDVLRPHRPARSGWVTRSRCHRPSGLGRSRFLARQRRLPPLFDVGEVPYGQSNGPGDHEDTDDDKTGLVDVEVL